MTAFAGDEVAAVLAAALVGLDDDASLEVVVHLPDGTQDPIRRAWYEPNTGRLVIEIERTVARARPVTPWIDEPLGVYDPRNPNWPFLADARNALRVQRRSPLRDINVQSQPEPTDPEVE